MKSTRKRNFEWHREKGPLRNENFHPYSYWGELTPVWLMLIRDFVLKSCEYGETRGNWDELVPNESCTTISCKLKPEYETSQTSALFRLGARVWALKWTFSFSFSSMMMRGSSHVTLKCLLNSPFITRYLKHTPARQHTVTVQKTFIE